MNRKSLLALLMALVLAFTAVACASTEKPDDTKAPAKEQTKAGGDTPQTEASEAPTPQSEPQSKEKKHVDKLIIGTFGKNDIFSGLGQRSGFGKLNYNGFNQGNFVYHDENGVVQPYFFKTFEISEDGKELVFTFPTDAVWHDGKPVTKEDIVFTFEYMKNVMQKGSLKNMESCKIEGEDTCRVAFSEPDAYSFLKSSTHTNCVLPKHVWEKVEDYREYAGEDAHIGCGPYKLVKVDKDSQTSYYEAVPQNSYLGEITVDKVVLQTYADENSLVMALMSGDIDVIYNYSIPVSSHVISTVEGTPDIDLGESDFSGHYQLTYGMERKPGEDLEFRKAVRTALDYKQLAVAINGKYGTAPGTGIIPPTVTGHDPSLPKLQQDLSAAAKILDAAGYVDKDNDGWRDMPDGSPLDVMVTTQYSVKRRELFMRMAEIIMNSLKEIKVKTHIDEESQRSDEVWEKNIEDGKYDLSIGYTTTGMAQYSSTFRYFLADPQFPEQKTWIWGTFHNDDFRDAYFAMIKAVNDEGYISNARKLQKMANDIVYAQALCWEKGHFPYRTDKYEGWINKPSWGPIHGKTWYTLTGK